jgi:type IV pilus assembly protein PilP
MKSLILFAAIFIVSSAAHAQDPALDPSSGGDSSMFGGFREPFDYDPRGRRDPFQQPIPDRPMEEGALHGPLLPLQQFELSKLRLVGIIWDVRHPKAIIKDPNGNTHLVSTNTKVGPRNGYIAVIREGEIVVVETQEQDGRLVSTAQVVKIAQ